MLDISPVLLLSSAVIFLLVLARLNSCLYKPLMKHMDDRAEDIKNDLDAASDNSADVNGLIKESNDIISEAKVQAAKIREEAASEASKIAQMKLNGAKEEIEGKYNAFVKSMMVEKETLEQELKASMPLFKDSLKAKISSI
jgi:F-type H+-transporting ATPase subunit b